MYWGYGNFLLQFFLFTVGMSQILFVSIFCVCCRIINACLKDRETCEKFVEKLTGFRDNVRVEQCGFNMSQGNDRPYRAENRLHFQENYFE